MSTTYDDTVEKKSKGRLYEIVRTQAKSPVWNETETALHPSGAVEILITLQLCSETVNMLNLNSKANLPINNKANFRTSPVIEFQKELNILISIFPTM